MFPIRCLIEAVDDDRCPKCSDSGSLVVSDSYAIVAGQTPLSQLVDTVLSALGLQHLGYGCKPMLQLKNWKPLTFDQISDEPDVEVETILKDVSNQLTLRILTKQSSTALQGSVNDLKDRLLRAILQKVPDLLSESQRTQWKVSSY
uniref:ULD domain-containing protein n=1 Tax=Romanomermis culicivorax TaxID=13658 RepID=A0A915I8E5_ROMCU